MLVSIREVSSAHAYTNEFPLEIPAAAAVEVSHGETAHEVDENHLQHRYHQVEHRQLEHLLQ